MATRSTSSIGTRLAHPRLPEILPVGDQGARGRLLVPRPDGGAGPSRWPRSYRPRWPRSAGGPDLIYGNRIMSTGWAIPAGKVTGAPVVCHEHGHSDHLSQRRIERLRRHVDRFVMVSRFVADLWLGPRDWTPTRSRWSSTGSIRRSTRSAATRSGRRHGDALHLDDEPFVVTYFGRLDREKGVHVLLTGVAPPRFRSRRGPAAGGGLVHRRKETPPGTGPSCGRWPPTACGSSPDSAT